MFIGDFGEVLPQDLEMEANWVVGDAYGSDGGGYGGVLRVPGILGEQYECERAI